MNFSIHDHSGHLSKQEVLEVVSQNQRLLQEVKSGEEQYSDSLGWLDLRKWAGEEVLSRIEAIAERVRREADIFVLIGVGGSNNAARSVIEGLGDGGAPQIVYAGNTISPNAMNRLLKQCRGKSVYIDCIAKNFETLEPGISFRVFRQLLKEQYGEKAGERIIATGTYGSSLEQLCRDNGYTFVPFPTDIGGRYTAMSYVGLLPMAVAGIDIRALVKGAMDMKERLFAEPAGENIAFHYAAARNILLKKGYQVEMLASFEPQFRWFYKWWIQLFAESEGKCGTGLFPVASEYSEELHAVGQYVQEGTHMLFETFLNVEEQRDSLLLQPDGIRDYFDYLDGKDFWQINKMAYEATLKAHSETLPCLVFTIPSIDAYQFGQLFYFFQFACYLSGKLLGVNPFDQPGVEAYKNWMFQSLGK